MTEPIPLWPNGAPEPDGVACSETPRLVPFVPESEAPRGTVIVCPGGGYARRADHEGAPVARMLNEAGIAAFVLHYRVSPHKHPAPLLDVQRAVRTIRARAASWNLRPDRAGVLGFSAGGHLAATLATHFDAGRVGDRDPVERVSCRPDAAVLCYAVIGFGEYGHGGSRANLLGENPPAELCDDLSNEQRVAADTPPAFLWHTAEDAGVPVQNSLRFADALARAGVPFELHVFPEGRHGLGLAGGTPGADRWPALCLRWLLAMGF